MFKIKLKKRITVSILTFLTLFLLRDNISFGMNNTSQNENRDIISQSQEDKDYLIWKAKYEENQKKIEKSKALNITSLITMGSGMFVWLFMARKKVTKGGGLMGIPPYTIKMPEYEVTEYNTALMIASFSLLAVATGLAMASYSGHKKAKKEKEALEEEGKIKGYLNLKLDPGTKSIAVTFSLRF